MILQERGVPLNGVDGRLEFVGHAGNEICLQCLGVSQLLDHPIEAFINIPYFLQLAVALHGHMKISARYLLHGLSQAGDRVDEGMGNIVGDSAAHHNAEQYRPDEDGNVHGNAQPALQEPASQFGQQHHGDKFCHADQKKFDPQRYLGRDLFFHSFTTL